MALTLRLLGGLSTLEVARSFLIAEPTLAKRLARAKHKIEAARIPSRVPEQHEFSDRLLPVLAVVYLMYNSGLTGVAERSLWQKPSAWRAPGDTHARRVRGRRAAGAVAPD